MFLYFVQHLVTASEIPYKNGHHCYYYSVIKFYPLGIMNHGSSSCHHHS